MEIRRDRTEKDPLVCNCGHTGNLVLRDRSSPCSPLLEYSLEGFTGAVVTALSYEHTPKNLLRTLNPTCPACGGIGTVGPPKRTKAEEAKLIAQYRRRERAERRVAERQIVVNRPAARKRVKVSKRRKAAKPN
jgi:hypothetical protein